MVGKDTGSRMEIEAKFVVPDAAMARRLRHLELPDEFSLGVPTRLTMQDTFFDTRATHLLKGRHVLRVRRRSDGRTFLTFKAPAQKSAAFHRRPETEVEISAIRTPRRLHVNLLPPRIKKLVAPLVHDEALSPLFSISQTREIRLVRRSRRIVAEWSLDHVRFRAGVGKRAFYELEIELKKTGQETDLSAICAWLESEFQLAPQPESKFARALEFMRGA